MDVMGLRWISSKGPLFVEASTGRAWIAIWRHEDINLFTNSICLETKLHIPKSTVEARNTSYTYNVGPQTIAKFDNNSNNYEYGLWYL